MKKYGQRNGIDEITQHSMLYLPLLATVSRRRQQQVKNNKTHEAKTIRAS